MLHESQHYLETQDCRTHNIGSTLFQHRIKIQNFGILQNGSMDNTKLCIYLGHLLLGHLIYFIHMDHIIL